MRKEKINLIFKAFADENRLRILSLLANGSLCVCDIMDVLKLGQSRISRHLSYLKRSGLVVNNRKGKWQYYTLAKPTLNFHKSLISCLRSCFKEVEILKVDVRKLKKVKKTPRQ